MKTACLFFLSFVTAYAAGDLVLADGGRSAYSIGLSAQASPSEKRGAHELQKFLGQMTGAELPIIDEAAAGEKPVIVVGEGALTRALKISVPRGESYLLRTAGNRLIIAGGRERGTMYGVYGFLDKLGCRWYTQDISRIPKRPRLAIAPMDETGGPAFEYRETDFAEAQQRDWAARNRMNGGSQRLDESTGGSVSYYPFVHSFAALVPVEKYFKTHPEYFSLIDGERRSEHTQLCLTNPNVLRIAVAQVREWIRQHPQAKIISVSQNDWAGWCECDRCRRVELEEGGAHSGPLVRFVNALAAEIEKTNPDKLIDTLAYSYTEDPPAKVRPRPNVRIRLCPIGACEAHPYEKCERNAYFMKNLRQWSRITNQLYIWHYNTDFANYLMPFPDYDELAADIPMYKRYGVVGIFLEGDSSPGGDDAEMRCWIMARLVWNPRTDVNRDIDDFLDGVYGPAARTMRAYHELCHKAVRGGVHLYIFAHSMAPHVTPELPRDGRLLLEKAEREATTEPARRRIRHFRLSLDYVEAARARQMVAANGEYRPADLDRARELYASVVKRARESGMTYFREGISLDNQVKEVESRLKPYRIYTIENEQVRVDTAPEISGRTIRLINKRTGYNAVRLPDPSERFYPDSSAFALTVSPNYYLPAYPITWKAASNSPAELVMEGTTENGLRLKRVLRLNGRDLVTVTTVENTGAAALPVAMQSRIDLSGERSKADVGFEYQTIGGRRQSGVLYRTGILGEGDGVLMGADRPAGEWTGFAASGPMRVVNRFETNEVARCAWSWIVRGENRLGMGIWTPEKTLAAGEKLTLHATYRVE